ncbi:MAG TPA: IPT/TIG domain-containing protein [Gemmatimonadales bacterium]|nr:IPT/TIG domain-containing protein [Gemmatimonadales bacterium]
MSRGTKCRVGTVIRVFAGTALFLGCQTALESPAGPEAITAAGGGGGRPVSGPSVTSASPAFGNAGEVGKRVTIRGSGFAPGAQAAWERGGAPDPKVTVTSTEFVSSTELVATITIAPDASIDLYDISVMLLDRKKGIGYARFEVTQAMAVPGTYPLRGANDTGEMTGGGNGTIWFNPASGIVVLDGLGAGWAIDQTGTVLVSGGPVPRLWNKIAGAWQLTLLPADPAATGGRASSLTADGTGQALFIGGLETVPAGKKATVQQPRVWRWETASGAWTRIILPTGPSSNGDVLGVSNNGVAAGWIGAFQAAVWEPNGAGYSLITLAPNGSRAMGINAAGTLIVGASGGLAAYWERLPGGGWSAPITLPGGCTLARAVDDLGRIVANDCPSGNRTTPAIFAAPYSTATMTRLGGLGPTNAGYAEGISPSGIYVVGQAQGVGVYWQIF